MDDFDGIIGANFDADVTPAHVFDYSPLAVSANAPAPIRPDYKVRQWALVDAEGRIVALGPATGGGKSAFIKFAAENPGHTVAHRWVTLGGWLIPTP